VDLLAKEHFDRLLMAKLGTVAGEGIADQQWRDAAVSGSDAYHNMPQH